MSDSIGVFAAHAQEYDEQRKRIVPCFEQFYGTAVELLTLRDGPVRRVLDLGAGTGLMSRAVLERHSYAELVLVDGAAEMIEQAQKQLPQAQADFVVADLRAPLPEGPFDAVVSALAIHHLEHAENRDLLARVAEVLRPGGVYVNAEHVAGPTPWLEAAYRRLWRAACTAAGAGADEIAAAERRMEADRSTDVATQLGWMRDAGLEDCDCFFKELHFAVMAGWAPV